MYDALNAGWIIELTVIVGGPDEAAAEAGLPKMNGRDKHMAMLVLWTKSFTAQEVQTALYRSGQIKAKVSLDQIGSELRSRQLPN